ncbi:hypothetical protein Thiosp_01900 [Thiorhodovibrio litoralis]|nr:hypothetical protein Thiosp_01900 [Thiorhodovibrio litoralis]
MTRRVIEDEQSWERKKKERCPDDRLDEGTL